MGWLFTKTTSLAFTWNNILIKSPQISCPRQLWPCISPSKSKKETHAFYECILTNSLFLPSFGRNFTLHVCFSKQSLEDAAAVYTAFRGCTPLMEDKQVDRLALIVSFLTTVYLTGHQYFYKRSSFNSMQTVCPPFGYRYLPDVRLECVNDNNPCMIE